jgi:hypothetical protein
VVDQVVAVVAIKRQLEVRQLTDKALPEELGKTQVQNEVAVVVAQVELDNQVV